MSIKNSMRYHLYFKNQKKKVNYLDLKFPLNKINSCSLINYWSSKYQ